MSCQVTEECFPKTPPVSGLADPCSTRVLLVPCRDTLVLDGPSGSSLSHPTDPRVPLETGRRTLGCAPRSSRLSPRPREPDGPEQEFVVEGYNSKVSSLASLHPGSVWLQSVRPRPVDCLLRHPSPPRSRDSPVTARNLGTVYLSPTLRAGVARRPSVLGVLPTPLSRLRVRRRRWGRTTTPSRCPYRDDDYDTPGPVPEERDTQDPEDLEDPFLPPESRCGGGRELDSRGQSGKVEMGPRGSQRCRDRTLAHPTHRSPDVPETTQKASKVQ